MDRLRGENMQVQTERGLIFVERYAHTVEEARELGYEYAFHSSLAKAKCFSKITGTNRRVFCLVEDKTLV